MIDAAKPDPNRKLLWALIIGGCLFPPLWIVAVFILVMEKWDDKK